jgi:TetR/AcrR family transcriptional repressor of bet genes
MPRPSNTLKRQAQITKGFARVLARVGYERATIAAIARSAQITAGLVHYHFSSKKDILLSLITYLTELARARYDERLSRAGDDVWARFDAAIAALIARGDDADQLAARCWTQIGNEASRSADVGVPYREAVALQHALITGHIAELRRFEGLSGDEERERSIAAAVLAMVEGAFHLAAASPAVVPAGKMAPLLQEMIRGLIQSEDCA